MRGVKVRGFWYGSRVIYLKLGWISFVLVVDCFGRRVICEFLVYKCGN